MRIEIEKNHDETNALKQQHYEDIEKYEMVKEEIKKINKNKSSFLKSKEQIFNAINQVSKQISQVEDRILAQKLSTQEFLDKVLEFQCKVKNVEQAKGNKTIIRKLRSSSALSITSKSKSQG